MKFSKYHALGNDYIVIDPKNAPSELAADAIKTICDRHYGVGADGILYGPLTTSTADFGLRIFNPDASEAEKSGNGLRIFARYLWDQALVKSEQFSVATKGGTVTCLVRDGGRSVSVGMGTIRFTHDALARPALSKNTLQLKDREFNYYLANVGNPHCVILLDEITPDIAKTYGSLIENHERFANRTNVQFVKVKSRSDIQIEIWERGAGYTLASGSSSIAAASVVHAVDMCDASILVHMPGGVIHVEFNAQFFATMTGGVQKICEGEIARESLT